MKFIKFNSGIYKIVDQFNEVLYVGKTTDFERRYSEHLGMLKNKNHDCELLQEYAHTFGLPSLSFKVVEMAPEELLTIKEKYWINKLDPLCNKNGAFALKVDNYNEDEKLFIKMVTDHSSEWFLSYNGKIKSTILNELCKERKIKISPKMIGTIMKDLGYRKFRQGTDGNVTCYILDLR